MTTSHRPQLEARSGAKAAGYTPTSTEHARLLPGHKKVKYRSPNKAVTVEKNYLEEDNGLEQSKEVESHDEEEEDSENDSEDELLQQELDRLKNKRLEEEKITNEEQEDVKISEHRMKKKSWRQGTTFSRNKVSKDSKQVLKKKDRTNNYTNNITQSDYHQEFMKKFIK
ncbi:pre-mRNA-splicing factor Cwc15p [Monosporozyma unispora]|nr:complexed with cef1p [Kazachstania unispora]